jgi:hypothetical protein
MWVPVCILEGLGIENVGIFCGHLEYFMAIWNISWPFDIFYGRLVHFPPLEYVLTRKVGQPEQKIPGLNPARV